MVAVDLLAQLDGAGQSCASVFLAEHQEVAIARRAVQEMLPTGIVQAGRSVRELGQYGMRKASRPGWIRVRVAEELVDLPLEPRVVVVGRQFSLCHRQSQDRLPEQADDLHSPSALQPMNVDFWMIPRRELA